MPTTMKQRGTTPTIRTRLFCTCHPHMQSKTPPCERSRPKGVTLTRGNQGTTQEHCRTERTYLRQKGKARKTDSRIPGIEQRLVVLTALQVHTTGRLPKSGSMIR